LAEKFAYYRNTRRFSGFEFSAQRDYGAIHSAMRRADAPVPLRKRVFGTNQDATAASMANILKQLPLSLTYANALNAQNSTQRRQPVHRVTLTSGTFTYTRPYSIRSGFKKDDHWVLPHHNRYMLPFVRHKPS
jgi:hypothetical protein